MNGKTLRAASPFQFSVGRHWASRWPSPDAPENQVLKLSDAKRLRADARLARMFGKAVDAANGDDGLNSWLATASAHIYGF